MHRPRALWITLVTLFTLGIASCSQSGSDPNTIVLYSSVDDYVLAEAVEAFETETGIEVRVVGDTEATKTTGLITRLLAEHESNSKTADVWWSSEPLGTVRLADAGVLMSYPSEAAESAFEEGWPSVLVGDENTWYGHALRARVIVHSTDRVPNPPTTLQELAEKKWKGRVGIARPRFGTTRGHMAALVDSWGDEEFEAWLTDLQANGVRVYDSNSSIVRAVWMGEIDAGLTDTDDVLVGQSRGWAVGMNTPGVDDERLVVPCTIGLVVGGANPDGAKVFIDWVLGGVGERVLYESESKNTPIHPEALARIREDDPQVKFLTDFWAWEPDLGSGYYEWINGRVPEAMEICERVLP